jgi:deoxycytidylate deaminase
MCKRHKKHFKLFATIYDKRGRILSSGENSYNKTHPFQSKLAKQAGREQAIYLHAEIQALVRLRDWTRAHRIVIERYDSDGNPMPACPCEICRLAIAHAGINIIEHT